MIFKLGLLFKLSIVKDDIIVNSLIGFEPTTHSLANLLNCHIEFIH